MDIDMIRITTPSRIHISLIDLNGSIGRVDGGIGLALNDPRIILEAKVSDKLKTNCEGVKADRILNSAKNVLKHCNIDGGIDFNLIEDFPSHSGLGSGTQLSLASGFAACRLYSVDLPVREIARIVGRGGTSGIGVAAFETGGFIVDGGHTFGKNKEKKDFRPSSASKGIKPPPVISRVDFPDWDIVLALPNVEKGAHAKKEVDIFKKYCPLDIEEVRELSHLILMRLLPAVVEENIDSFGEAIRSIQNIGFKRIEVELQHPVVKKLLKELNEVSYTGMSSFGPLVFSFTHDGKEVAKYALEIMEESVKGKVWITKANNIGIKIEGF